MAPGADGAPHVAPAAAGDVRRADPAADDETVEINISRADMGYDPYQSGRVKKPRLGRS
jgi:hypothetical protein